MTNEWIFIVQLIFLGLALRIACHLGKEALLIAFTLQALIANLFVLKQIDLWGFHVTSSDLYAIGCLVTLYLLQERWGRAVATQALHLSCAALLFFLILAEATLFYTPNSYDTLHPALEQLISPLPRLLASSLLVFYLVQRLEIYLAALLRQKWPTRPLLTAFTVVTVSQVSDTFLFGMIALYGWLGAIGDAMLFALLLKLSCSWILLPLARARPTTDIHQASLSS